MVRYGPIVNKISAWPRSIGVGPVHEGAIARKQRREVELQETETQPGSRTRSRGDGGKERCSMLIRHQRAQTEHASCQHMSMHLVSDTGLLKLWTTRPAAVDCASSCCRLRVQHRFMVIQTFNSWSRLLTNMCASTFVSHSISLVYCCVLIVSHAIICRPAAMSSFVALISPSHTLRLNHELHNVPTSPRCVSLDFYQGLPVYLGTSKIWSNTTRTRRTCRKVSTKSVLGLGR